MLYFIIKTQNLILNSLFLIQVLYYITSIYYDKNLF